MSVQNELAAKIMGEILAKGMNLCDINLADSINSDAAAAIEEIQSVVADKNGNEKKKLTKIREIIKKLETEAPPAGEETE